MKHGIYTPHILNYYQKIIAKVTVRISVAVILIFLVKKITKDYRKKTQRSKKEQYFSIMLLLESLSRLLHRHEIVWYMCR